MYICIDIRHSSHSAHAIRTCDITEECRERSNFWKRLDSGEEGTVGHDGE